MEGTEYSTWLLSQPSSFSTFNHIDDFCLWYWTENRLNLYSINEMCDPPVSDDDEVDDELNVNDDAELSLQDEGKEVITYASDHILCNYFP